MNCCRDSQLVSIQARNALAGPSRFFANSLSIRYVSWVRGTRSSRIYFSHLYFTLCGRKNTIKYRPPLPFTLWPFYCQLLSTLSPCAFLLSEHIHSVGRVLGDRSVLYKYLNPNLIAVVTAGGDVSAQTNSIAVYLIDVVAGRILYSASHRRCSEPVSLVHSENWIVVSNQSLWFRTYFSSLYRSTDSGGICESTGAHSLIPQVLQQSYIFSTAPTHGAAAASLTERGITSKSVICKSSIDHMEEGVHPYAPVLPLSDQAVISYNQTVLGVRAIRTAPTGLESTSLVFAYGLGEFFVLFARIVPLTEDFDYTAIATVTLGMIVASVVTQRLAARRAVMRAWS
ncbi:unnamed protein product [Echinostoma caproni]|uniref:ER membrane protein complex subunit 1 n=1 Tax=Echinostoma caproni TaxID=27848 RepID=A0A183ARM6_9TREM|nr:unnamed protein product [Echinostoma caproni]